MYENCTFLLPKIFSIFGAFFFLRYFYLSFFFNQARHPYIEQLYIVLNPFILKFQWKDVIMARTKTMKKCFIPEDNSSSGIIFTLFKSYCSIFLKVFMTTVACRFELILKSEKSSTFRVCLPPHRSDIADSLQNDAYAY